MAEGIKYDQGKPRFSLIPAETMYQVVQVLEYGAHKYSPDNWREVPDLSTRYYDAMMRHVYAHRIGEFSDPETGLPHLAHAICCLMFMLEAINENGDGRPIN